MLEQKGSRGRTPSLRNRPPSNASMAEALRAVGLDKKQKNVPISRAAPPSAPEPVRDVKPKTAAVSDREHWQKECSDVAPLNVEASASPGERRTVRKHNVATKPASKGQDTVRPGRKLRRRRATGSSGRRVRARPEVITASGADGRKQVVIRGEFLEAGRKVVSPTRKSSYQPSTTLVFEADLAIRPAVLKSDDVHLFSDRLECASVAAIEHDSDEEIDLVIGLDFGTTYCKIVLQEQGSGRAWAIPFSADSDNPYLLCTKVWKADHTYSLSHSGVSKGNLKMALFSEQASHDDVINAAAFVGLVLRHVKGWFWQHKSMEFPRMSPFWFAHMGLPARDFDNRLLTRKFRQVLWAGMLLAERAGSQIHESDVRECLSAVDHALTARLKEVALPQFGALHLDQVSLYPEIASQIYGYLKSDLHDPSQDTFMLVDVGGGTVDAALFKVVESDEGETQFVFRGAAVERLGVYMLHRQRIEWHIQQIAHTGRHRPLVAQLQDLLDRSAIPTQVPGSIEDYIAGVRYPEETCDRGFCNAFGAMLYDNVVLSARNRVGNAVEPGRRLQFLLCGGGRSVGLYQQFVERINSPKSSTQLRLHRVEIDRPAQLEPRSLGKSEYHRLSVAYGLSFLDIGEVITPENLPPPPPRATAADHYGTYISQEMV